MFALTAAGLVLRVLVELSLGGLRLDGEDLKSWLSHVLALVPFAAMWAICRKGPKPVRLVEALETAGTFAACCALLGMTIFTPAVSSPHLIAALLLTQLLVVRAAMVPSTAGRTFALALAVAVPYIAAAFWMYEAPILSAPRDPHERRFLIPPFAAVASAVALWTMTTIISAFISKVIFGLRREVRAARQLGPYTLMEKLGEGGMGEVFRARHAMLRRPTAVKLLSAERAGRESLARFEREVQLTAELTHPNTITIFDYGRAADGTFYYAMELLDGATVDQIVHVTGAQPIARVVHVLRQVGLALVEAHARGLIHRDIKPANVMLCERGGVQDVAKVLDFGLVKSFAQADGASLTGVQTVLGTPAYMAPEAVTDPDSVDARSDLYALGALGFFMLTGEHVFTGRTVVEILSKHLHEPPRSPSAARGSAIPAALEQLVLDCLAKSPSARPESARAFVERLEACAIDQAWTSDDARRWWAQHGAALRRQPRQSSGVSLTELAPDRGLKLPTAS